MRENCSKINYADLQSVTWQATSKQAIKQKGSATIQPTKQPNNQTKNKANQPSKQ